MITFAELEYNGFVKDFEWNNRTYFTKNGFNIVEHFGVSRYDEDHLSGYDENFETIEELNEAYKEWVKKIIDEYEKLGDIIKFLKESLY